MKINELSKKSGVSPRMLRYYEEQGLIRPMRLASGYRDYCQNDISVLKNIKALQEAGLTLNVIRVLMPCIISQPVRFDPCPLIVATLKDQRFKLQRTIEDQSRALSILEQYLEETGQMDVPEILPNSMWESGSLAYA
ncbi:MerR family transcriptional regulator [Pseudomonas sp. TWP3-2]|uniref:MerR family transcriptional regulator n=1 Tax=Pseudomonas sp. TWP3-2 TaxID=2804574 RepID=UPI003CEF4230